MSRVNNIKILVAVAHLACVSAAAAQETTADFPVPTITIQVGDTIADEFIVERRLIANAVAMRTHFTNRENVVGKVARRIIPAGAAIPINALREPTLFKEGERVTFEFKSGALSIQSAGIALQPGILGQSIRVRNLETGSVVIGVVRPDGVVEIGGG